MSNDGFVERPAMLKAGAPRDPNSIASRLLVTADNGKALLIKLAYGQGNLRMRLRYRGYRSRCTKNGAPAGMVYAWAEKIEASA